MNDFDKVKYGRIKGLSERRRLPLLGKIRLGKKVLSQNSGKEYPKETDYFVVPDEIKKVYGEGPKELDIMIPVAARHICFATAYRWYGQSKGIRCIGNGETAMRKDDVTGDMNEIECPCDKLKSTPEKRAECSQKAFLMVILPKVNMGGVYQICTSSFNSIIDINSGLDYIEALIGRCQMIPLKLKREKVETRHEGKKQTHYSLKIQFDGNIDFINNLRENTKKILLETEKLALPAPVDENPESEPIDEVEKGIIEEEQPPETKQDETKPDDAELTKTKNTVENIFNEPNEKAKEHLAKIKELVVFANNHKLDGENICNYVAKKINIGDWKTWACEMDLELLRDYFHEEIVKLTKLPSGKKKNEK